MFWKGKYLSGQVEETYAEKILIIHPVHIYIGLCAYMHTSTGTFWTGTNVTLHKSLDHNFFTTNQN